MNEDGQDAERKRNVRKEAQENVTTNLTRGALQEAEV